MKPIIWIYLAFLTPVFFSFIILLTKDGFKLEKSIKVLGSISSFISLVCLVLYAFNINFEFNKFNFLSPQPTSIENNTGISIVNSFVFFQKIDNISFAMLALTAFIFFIAFLSCFNSVKTKVKKYIILMLMLEFCCFGFFMSSSIISFYVFFEAGLIPMFLMIGVWGGENRIYASLKFFIYTFAGSVFLLGGIIFLSIKFSTFDIATLTYQMQGLDQQTQNILWLCFFVSFAIKLPSFPLHTWLPDAHVQAPTSASVILAAILIKMGGYGIIRFILPALPLANQFFQHFVIILGLISIVYAAFIAIKQDDIKKMIAYSSVSHMGYVTIGLFSLNKMGVNAAIFQMISHGIVSAGLFLAVGVLYERLHTKKFSNFGGCATTMPSFAVFLMILTMSSVGLPTMSGFVGEFASILSVFTVSIFYSIFAASGAIFGCIYMLKLYRQTMFGKITNSQINYLKDINGVEKFNFAILSLSTIVLGIYPNFIYGIL